MHTVKIEEILGHTEMMKDNENPKCVQCNNPAQNDDSLCQGCSDKVDLVCALNCGDRADDIVVSHQKEQDGTEDKNKRRPRLRILQEGY